MPALPPYIPPKQGDFNAFVNNFSTLITASPSTYGLLPSDAVSIATAVATWNTAYALITSPTTKTASAVQMKNTAQVTLKAVIRPYAQNIALNPGVTSANKVALGLNPRTSTPSPITPPTSTPVLTIQSLAALSAIIRYRDSAASVSVKAKPYGVKSCQLFGKASATPVTDPTTMMLLTTATKSPTTLTFFSGLGGMQMYVAAVWAIQTGGTSPWSGIINFTIPTA